jgi:hypothetical protein
MRGVSRLAAALLALGVFAGPRPLPAAEGRFLSHPPLRPLPAPSGRALAKGPARFVDAARGNDGHDGSKGRPWRTVNHALKQLRPGDTLYLRGGVYYENVSCAVAGTKDAPITLRSYPGELAVLDGGLRDFFEKPASSWEPFRGGAEGEFRSVKVYPGRAGKGARRGVYVLGNFGDSMVPLHGYRFLVDFRSANEFWNLKNNSDTKEGVYLGPGLWYDPETGHIHVRLTHLKAKGYGDDRYHGETDPRKLPLVISGTGTPLRVEGAKHLRLQDLVVRGATGSTVHIARSENVTLENVTVYGGSPALSVETTRGLRILDSAVRGLSAPWSTRAGHKYRGKSPYLLTCGRDNRDFEFAHSEFTDNHDGLTIGTVIGMRFHHNLVENFDDDGVYLNARSTGGDIQMYQNRFARILSTLAFSGRAKPGRGVYLCRNVFDLRRPVYGSPPKGPDDRTPGLRPARAWGDHGSPTWEPMYLYHNTVILPGPEFRRYYGAGWGGHTRGTRRRVFNNLFVHVAGMPGLNFAAVDDDFQADGNLHWSVQGGPTYRGDFFAAFRKSKVFEASKERYPPGWGAHDVFADPRFVRFAADGKEAVDLRLQAKSPAVDAGVEVPGDWPDPLRKQDKGKPDIGALPLGAEPFKVGKTGKP